MNKSHALSRRSFIKTTGLAISAGMLPLASPLAAGARKKWPVGCRDLHLNVAGLPDSWSCMKALGAECTEVYVELNLGCANLFHPQRKYTLATADGIQVLKDDLASSGCRVTAFMMSNRFDERLEAELESARGLVKAAQQLGVDIIRIDMGPLKLKGDQLITFAINTGKRLCEIAEGTPIRFGVENHGLIMNNPEVLEKLFNGVGSPKLGLTLDCANFNW